MVEIAGYAMAWVGYAEPDATRSVRPVAFAGIEAGYLANAKISYGDDEHGRGPTGTAIRTGEVQVSRDLAVSPEFEPWRAIALERGYRSSAAFPLVADGRAFGALSVYALVPDAFTDDAVALLTALAIDLAFGIKAERAVAESERRLIRILDRMSTFVVLMDPDGRALTINDAPLAATGLTRADVIGQMVYDLPQFAAEPASRAALRDGLNRARRGEAVRLEIWMRLGGDRRILIDARLEPFVDAAGHVVEIVGSGIDATDEYLAKQALRASEERFRAIVENAMDLITVVGLDGTFRMISPSVEAMGGYRPDQLLGQSMFGFIHPDDAAAAAAALRDLVASHDGLTRITLRFRHASGSYRTVQVAARNLAHVPAIAGILVNSRDVTDQLAAETMLRQAEKLEAVGQLASGVAHDFNNLLTVVLANAEVLAQTASSPAIGEIVEEVRSAAVHASELTSRILSFARRGSGRRQPVDVHQIVREVCQLALRTVDRRITIESDLAAADPMIVGDATELQSAILNLAINARDAMPAGGRLTFATRNVTLDVAAASAWPDPLAPGTYVEITVDDTGEGIPPELGARLFEPFFTTKAPDKGTGLGLAGVRTCARGHGGSVAYTSEVGRGTTFRLIIPCSSMAILAPVPARAAPAAGAARVLIVDDDEMVRRVIARALTSLGYEVSTCGDADAAIEQVRSAAHDHAIVVLDVNMPGRSGFEVLAAIRAVAPALPVVLCSGYAPTGVPGQVREDPKTSFLAKPFTIDGLAAAMTRALGR